MPPASMPPTSMGSTRRHSRRPTIKALSKTVQEVTHVASCLPRNQGHPSTVLRRHIFYYLNIK